MSVSGPETFRLRVFGPFFEDLTHIGAHGFGVVGQSRLHIRMPQGRADGQPRCKHQLHRQFGTGGTNLLLRGHGSRREWQRKRRLKPGTSGDPDALGGIRASARCGPCGKRNLTATIIQRMQSPALGDHSQLSAGGDADCEIPFVACQDRCNRRE
jgi:hypothetical protein